MWLQVFLFARSWWSSGLLSPLPGCLGGVRQRHAAYSWAEPQIERAGPFTSLHFHEREKNLCVVEATVTWFLFR